MYGLLGRKLSHSLSPEIHAYYADYEYRLISLAPDELPAFFAARDFDGINVTIPYKETVIPYCDSLSDEARGIGSVNTVIRRPDGSLYGDNTDYFGFCYLLKSRGVSVGGRKALILGSGGTSKTVRAALSALGARDIVTVSRTGADNYRNLTAHADAEIIVNTTPVGMYPDGMGRLIELNAFARCRFVADVIYNPLRTGLILDAIDRGVPCAGGITMLAAQGFGAAQAFLDRTLDETLIERAAAGLTAARTNIVLIGMPGAGKTTVAAELSRLTGREAVDTDALVERDAGLTIPEIFKRYGEAAFREMEARAVAEAGARGGIIISTGGGAPLREENRMALRQNGAVISLTRDIECLSADGRPLSKGIEELREMARIRAPLYASAADFTAPVLEGRPEDTARACLERLGFLDRYTY